MSTVPEIRKIVLGPHIDGTRMTPEEFDAVEEWDEEYRYELVDGVLEVNPLPLGEETDPNEELGHWLRSYRTDHPEGNALDMTLPQQYVRIGANRRIADRLIWTGYGRLPHRVRDLPTIAVEFVSAGRRSRERDYVAKRREYMAVGIAEYWIFDRFQRTLTVIGRRPDGGQDELVIREGESYQPPLLPGFEVPLAHLLALADRQAEAGE